MRNTTIDSSSLRFRDDRVRALYAVWSALAEVSGNVFSTPEFADSFLARLVGDSSFDVLAFPEQGAAVVVVALVLERIAGLRVARLLGSPVADDSSPACAPEDRARAASVLTAAADDAGADILLAEQLPVEHGWQDLLGGKVLASEPSPVIRFDGRDWSAYLASRSANFRQQVRRRTRQLERLGARYRLADADSLEADLDTLFALHRARWGTSSTFSQCEPFHRDFAVSALERGWLRLWILEVAGEPVAATYGFRFGASESYYQGGRSTEWNRFSPGLVLLAHAVRNALEDGLSEFRLLRGGERHKFRFTDDGSTLVSLAVGRTARGRAAIAAARHVPRPLLRQLAASAAAG